MKLGWPLSLIFHALGVFGGIFMFSGAINTADEARIIPVEIVNISEQTNIRAAKKASKKKDIKEAEPPMRVETPAPKALADKDAELSSEALPKPIATESPKSNNTLSNDPAIENLDRLADPIIEPEKRVEAPKLPSFDLDRMSALIDQTRSSQPETNQGQALQSEITHYAFAKTARDGAGLETELTTSEVDALRARMYKCWRMSVDARNAEDLIIRVRVQLFPDGGVKDVDLLDRVKIASRGDPYVQIAAERALRAVSKCAPYDFLPQDKYSSWKDMELSFRPVL